MKLLEDLIIDPECRLRVWEIREGSGYVINSRNTGNTQQVLNCVRSFPGLENQEIVYNMHGKPLLSDPGKGFISLSHSHSRLAIIHDRKADTGIDIEKIGDKVLRIRYKFMSKEELEEAGEDAAARLLHIYWGAKESLYKLHGTRQLVFSEHLRLQGVNDGMEGELEGMIRIRKSTLLKKLAFLVLGEYMLVYIRNR